MTKNKMCISLIDDFWFTDEEKKDFVLKRDYIFPPMYFYSFHKDNIRRKKMAEEFFDIIKKNEDEIFH